MLLEPAYQLYGIFLIDHNWVFFIELSAIDKTWNLESWIRGGTGFVRRVPKSKLSDIVALRCFLVLKGLGRCERSNVGYRKGILSELICKLIACRE